ncbi:MAG: DNA adenine methylase [Bacteroidales bacterium]|jgi:adenine-specific DNA-methyltransferase|nr:DNA adenine methylase [Bacteroidales bacterium]
MYTIGHILKEIREESGYPLQEVQQQVDIDLTQLSKIENGKRLPTTEQLLKLAKFYNYDEKSLIIQKESDKIAYSFEYPEIAVETLQVAEAKVMYGKQYLPMFQNAIYRKPISLESRRYIGSKAKLTDWIMDLIDSETKNVNTFADIFAGTASVSNQAILRYNKVIINDILHSNNIIYKGFFEAGKWNESKLNNIITRYNTLNPDNLEENYFSKNFGGKFYEHNIAKTIGYIRQDIEDRKSKLTEKEYSILLATLIYNIDKIANTVGHFDAYIKKPIKPQPLHLRLINAQDFDNVEIYREDANKLAKKLKSDLVYIDPPYNSRQYCSAYHLLENLVLWKKPELKGVAMKPAIIDGKSEYCTNDATTTFENLVNNLNTHYIVLSYNNMANKGNCRSNAKIKDEDIHRILSKKGELKVFSRPYKAFSTGKSNIENNEERIFLCKIKI